MRNDRTRKGQTIGVDFALSLAVFILVVGVGLYYTTTTVISASPFAEQVESASVQAADEFRDATDWRMTEVPVTVRAGTALEDYPVEMTYFYPSNLNRDSPLVMRGKTELPSQQDYGRNQTVFFPDIVDGTERYRLVYTTSALRLEDRRYNRSVFVREIGASTFEAWNDDINVTFDSEGIDEMLFNGTSLINDTELDALDVTIENVAGPLRTTFLYDENDDKRFRVFGPSNEVRFFHDNTGQAVYHINLSADFDQLRVANESGSDQTIALSGGDTHFNGETDLADFTGPDIGLGLMREDMELYVYRAAADETLQVNMTVPGAGETLFMPHHDEDISDHETLFFNPPEVTGSVTRTLEGVSRQRADDFESMSVEEQRNELGLFEMDYNISINGTLDIGDEIPDGQEVYVQQHPVTILDRWGNFTLKDFRIAAWL